MQQNNQNILLATILSALVLIGWTWFYEKPRIEKQEQEQKLLATSKPQDDTTLLKEQLSKVQPKAKTSSNPENPPSPQAALLDRIEVLDTTKEQRIIINNPQLKGSLYLKGARFDDLILTNYHQTIDKNSPEVALLAPSNSKERYFADFGWVSSDSSLELPRPDTLWQSSSNVLTPEQPITLYWKSWQNLLFTIRIELDQNYMFSITQTVHNLSGKPIALSPYGRLSRTVDEVKKPYYILHEGPIGVFDGLLKEINYKDLAKENNQNFEAKEGWLGITDKYWLTSLVIDKNLTFSGNFSYQKEGGNSQNHFYNSSFLGQEQKIASGEERKFTHYFFAGAKKVTLLDEYSKKYGIKLFDRAIDFGWYYFLTKPFFFILQALSSWLGNYGLAILAMTILVKALMFPLANKSYLAMDKIKKLQPKIQKIRENCKDDKLKMNKEIMELYKKEKANPASGCLPILIQIPVFFSLYKVLFVTIDMRHAPFYGWIKDLSAPDPTSIFNLFGLLPFEIHGFLSIGVWPILMGITMVIQQKLNPQGLSDPTQEKVMKMLPFILIFVFASFPAGLLIYWTWSNLLSILQQYLITKFAARKSAAKS